MKEDYFRILKKEDLKDPQIREQIFHELREFFGEPCLPASQYCKALYTWAEIRSENDEEFEDFYHKITIDIHKSCLLDRLIYAGGELRKEKCPVHKGHWSGIDFGKNKCECVGECGCITGWLPNKKEDK